MASNTSQRKAQATILASQVEAYRTWFLIADCGQCGPRARRMTDFPIDITMQRPLLRLRCRVCGKLSAAGRDRQRGAGHLAQGGQDLGGGELRVSPGPTLQS